MPQQISAYEQCKTKLRAAEMFHQRNFSQEVKNTAAVVIRNTLNAYESIGNTAGLGLSGNSGIAQVNPISSYKNFIIKIASLGIPALDVFDWVTTEAMATASTNILFTRYMRMSDKGTSKKGDIISDPFGIYYRDKGNGDREDVQDYKYTSALTSDAFADNGSTVAQKLQLRWKPIRQGTLIVTAGSKTANEKTGTEATASAGYDYAYSENGITVEINRLTGELSVTMTTANTKGSVIMVAYEYDNIKLPSEDIPTYSAEVLAIPMSVKPHRLRIVFDSLTNLFNQNDYNIDFTSELPKKATEDFMYSIASEVADEIIANAPELPNMMPWSLAVDNGWILQHYASFGAVLTKAQAAITKVTKRYVGNRCFIGTELLPVVAAVPGWKPSSCEGKLGTQLVGTLNGLKVYYRPEMDDYTYVVWAKGEGHECSVGLLGFYMAALPGSLVPTQMLEFADGLSSQGFYALYDFKIINPMLSCKGKVSH